MNRRRWLIFITLYLLLIVITSIVSYKIAYNKISKEPPIKDSKRVEVKYK
jgi:uncharacterized protein YneF (UPF0154 family)